MDRVIESVVFSNTDKNSSVEFRDSLNEEIALGRGPLLEITDAKVSRNHAFLSLDDAKTKLYIKPVSKNPTFFYEKTSNSTVFKRRILPKDVCFELKHEDKISFLPDSLVFEIEINYSKLDKTLDVPIDQCLETSDGNVQPSALNSVLVPESQNAEIVLEVKAEDSFEISPDKFIKSSIDEDVVRSPSENANSFAGSPRRKRNLPEWMAKTSPIKSNKNEDATFKTPKVPARTSRQRSKSPGADMSSLIIPDNVLSSTRLSTELGKISPGNEKESPSDNGRLSSIGRSPVVVVERLSSDSLVSNGFEESNQNVDIESSSQFEDDTSPRVDNVTGGDRDHRGKATTTTPAPTTGHGDRRRKCHYGRKCYRTNAAHKREMSHPGDSDHSDSSPEVEEEQMDGSAMDQSDSLVSLNISTPICPYGRKCYRRNAAHRANYRHDVDPDLSAVNQSGGGSFRKKKTPGRHSATRGIRGDQLVADQVDESYDYADSFINDGSDLEGEQSQEYDQWEEGEEEEDESDSSRGSNNNNKNNRRSKQLSKNEKTKKVKLGSRRARIDSSDEEDESDADRNRNGGISSEEDEDLSLLLKESKKFIKNDKLIKPAR